MTRVGWLDASCGVSGDMLLGALADLGALTGLPAMLDSLVELGVTVSTERVSQHGLAATACTVSAAADQPHRGLADVLAIVSRAAAPDAVRAAATSVFRTLAEVEAAIHSTTVDEVHFHEVGAVDSIVDVLAACLGLHTLGLDALVVSPVALGGGTVQSAHGTLRVPVPAVLGLLRDTLLVSHGGPYDVELATPTGVAVLAQWATASGPMPAMRIEATGVGAGSRQLADRANVVRLVVGDAETSTTDEPWLVLEANVDDLDPRLWPGVIDQLLAAGAGDAWLTPILMKKGRPAHTVSALTAQTTLAAVRAVLLRETSTIGVRMTAVTKHALDRSWVSVDIAGQPVRVKLAHDGDTRMNLSPEFADVAAAAGALGLPAKDVLARATAAALAALEQPGPY
jgi:hypothetical protein